jgi:hypothetical protein
MLYTSYAPDKLLLLDKFLRQEWPKPTDIKLKETKNLFVRYAEPVSIEVDRQKLDGKDVLRCQIHTTATYFDLESAQKFSQVYDQILHALKRCWKAATINPELIKDARTHVQRICGERATVKEVWDISLQHQLVIETPLGTGEAERLLDTLYQEWWIAAMPPNGSTELIMVFAHPA